MKFNVPALALVASLPLLAAAQNQCDSCDLATINKVEKVCTHPWVDKIVSCTNAPCNVKYPEDPRLQCEGDFGDGTLNTTSTVTVTGTATMTKLDIPTGTIFPMPTIINDIDPSTTPSSVTGTSRPSSTTTSTNNGTTTRNSTSTTSAPKTSESGGAAAPAFSGIGFGGGAAAMVGLAGLVGLVL